MEEIIMFRFREVERNIERENLTNKNYDDGYEYNFDKRIGEEGFRKIKPETDITIEEAKAYWYGIFDQRI